MSGRVLRFEGSAHQESERLLPWLVNGTLRDDELRLVQQHLGECEACQHEVAWLRSLQAACADEPVPAAATTRSLRRLHRRLRSTGDGPRRGWGRRQRWLGWVIAAQAVLVLALGVALFRISRPPPAPAYHTLSAAPAPSERLVVRFAPTLTEAPLRQLLLANDARIVDGPTEAGGWVLSVPAARAPAVRAALRAAPGVTLVESLGPAAD